MKLRRLDSLPVKRNITGNEYFVGIDATDILMHIADVKNYFGVSSTTSMLGIATPTSMPVAGDGFYIALEAGTYVNFGGVVVKESSLAVIFAKGGVFTITQTNIGGGYLTDSDINAPGGVTGFEPIGKVEAGDKRAVSGEEVFDKAMTKSKYLTNVIGKNLFNKNDLQSGKRIHSSGSIIVDVNNKCSSYIKVLAGKSYIISGWIPSGTPKRWSLFSNIGDTSSIKTGVTNLVSVDVDCFLVINLNDSVLSTTQIEIGTVASSYTPYSSKEFIGKEFIEPPIGKVEEGDKRAVSGGEVFDFIGSNVLSKSDFNGVIEFPNELNVSFFYGYIHPNGNAIMSPNALSVDVRDIIENTVYNIIGYMHRNTVGASGMMLRFFNENTEIGSGLDIGKINDPLSIVSPQNANRMSIIVASNYDGLQDLDSYKETFKLFKGAATSARLIIPEPKLNTQDYFLYDSKFRNDTRKSKKIVKSVKSLRNSKLSNYGDIEINIQNRLGVDIENAIAIIHLHHGTQKGAYKLTNDYFMKGLCNTDFSDIRFSELNGDLLDIQKQSNGNYEIVADNRLRFQMYPSSDGSVFGSPSAGGVYVTTDNFTTSTIVSTDGVISGVNALGDVFYYKNNNIYKRKKSENFSTERMVLSGNSAITGEILWQVGAFVLDDLNNIYVAPYQGDWDGKIYKSIDNGEIFSLIHQNQKQHCHSMVVDKTTVPYTIYANFDGNAAIIGEDISAGTFKSIDRGATWEALEFPFSPDFGVMHSANGVQIGGGEGALKNIPTNYRGEKDTNWETILNEQASVFRVISLNGNIYFAVTTADQYKYAKIFRSTDNGKTYDVILDTGYRNVKSTAGGWRYGSPIVATPSGDESQLLLHYASVVSTEFPPIRIYEGGEHFQAMYYIRIPFLPASGKNIKVGYGYLMEDVDGGVFNEMNLKSNIYNFPLNDFGNKVVDSDNNTYDIGDSEWTWRESVNRFGKIYPHETPYTNNAAVVLRNKLEINNNHIKKSKDFSFSFNVKTKRYNLASTEELHILSNDYLSFYFLYDSRLMVKYGNNTAFVKGILKNLQLEEFLNIVVTISNELNPVMRVYANTWLVNEETATLNNFSLPINHGNWKLGGSDMFYMSDFKFFNKEINHNDVISLFEGGRVSNT